MEYIIKLLQQVNIKNPEEAAQKILSLETLLAEIQFSEVENRDPDKIYNKFKVSNLNDLYPYIEWNSYLKSAEIPETEKFIIIKQLRYIIGLGNLLNDIPLNTWKIYLKYRLVNAFAPLLSENFYNLNFNFYGKNPTGLEKDKPRSEKAIMLINDSIGEAFGKLYVQKFFPPR